jgi:hypothetical protein
LFIANEIEIREFERMAENMNDFKVIIYLIGVAIRFLPGTRLWRCKGGRNEGGGRRVRIGVLGREGWREERAWLGRPFWGKESIGITIDIWGGRYVAGENMEWNGC